MDRVIELLEGIEKATKETAQAIARTSLGKDLMKSLNADGVKREGKEIQSAVKQIGNALSPLKSEFRALRAESRNIDFGEMTDTAQFKKASNEIGAYIKKLKELENQISGSTPADREFKASLQSQQRMAGDKVKMAKANRDASMAAERISFSEAIGSAGSKVTNIFAEPLESAMELQKSMAGVKKLANDLTEAGGTMLQNQVFNLSAKLGVEDTKVSEIFEDLAGSGKKFSDEMGGVGSRIAEVEQILKNQQALDISSGVATQLDVTLGSIYKNLVSKDPNAIVELNARVASSVNQLADKLSDVRISAEEVIPVMNVVMNTVGDAANFPVDQIAAYSAAIASLGTIEPEAAGSFFNRMSAKMSENTTAFASTLNMSVEDFEKELNTDKLSVITRLAEAYKNVEGGELKQGAFFSSIGVGSVQDQKLLQGLANQLNVLKDASTVAKGGFMGKEILELTDPKTGKKILSLGENLKKLSVDEEIENVMRQAAFQSERFNSSAKALKDTLGFALVQVITPFKSLAADLIGALLHLTQIAPGLTKVLTALVFGLGTLAAAAGTAGVALFGFQQAQAIATTAAITMQSSLIPLTGFFQTSMNAFKGTFPWTNAFQQSTVMAEEFAVAATGAKGLVAGELRTAFIGLRTQVVLTSQAALSMGRAFLLSPLGMAVGSFLLLDQLLQRANPQVRLLGTLFSVFSSAAGFAFGILEGFVGAFLKLLKVPVGAAGGLLASPFTAIAQALEFAMESFKNWERSGKHIGESIFNILANPFIFAASATAGAWDRTIGFVAGLLKPLADLAAYIGHFIQGSLSEASPGPSLMTRVKWAFTAVKVAGSFLLMQIASMVTGGKIREFMGAAAAWVVTNWQVAVQKVNEFFTGLTLPESLNDFAVQIGNAWNNTFGMMASGWTNFVSTFTSTTPDFGGLAFAGMAAMKPLLAWGLPDIVSENFDRITQPRSPEIAPKIVSPTAPQQPEPVAQISEQVRETQTIWQQMWTRIGDLTQQGIERVRGAIETNLGTGVIALFDKIGAVATTFFQNMTAIAGVFKGQSGNILTPFVGVALVLWEIAKAAGALSKEFMGFEEGFLHKVIDNFNLLGFTALMLSSMLMNLVQVPFEALRSLPGLFGAIAGGVLSLFGLGSQKLLEEGASKYVSFLKVFERPGIGTALAKGLPGIVAVLMGMNVFEDLTQQWTATLIGWSNHLPQIVESIATNFEGIFNFIEPSLRSIYPEGINIFPAKEARAQAYETLGEVGAIFATFWQNIAASAGKVGDAIKPIFEAIATVKIMTVPQLFANYMGFGDAVQPVTDFIHSLPLLGMPIAELTVIEAAIGAIFDLLKSPTLKGFVGFLTGPLFNALVAIGKTFFTLGSTIAIAFLGIPIFIVKNALEKARIAGEATKKGLLDPLARGAAVAKQAVIDRLKLVPGIISGLLRKIPVIGTFIANAFDMAMSGIGKVFLLAREALPGYLAAMRTQLGILKTAFVDLGVALGAVGLSLVGAAKYIINEALIPLAEAIGFLNPFKLIALYAQTKGFQGVTKGVNPIDLAVTGIDDALVAVGTKLGAFGKLEGEALKTAQNAFRPLSNLLSGSVQSTAKNIAEQAKNVAGAVASGTGEAIDRAFPIRVLSAKLIAVRKTYLGTKAALAYDKAYVMGFNLGPVMEGFVLLRAVFLPMLQIVARAAFSWMTYYTVLEAFTPALLNTINAFARAHTELGVFSKFILGSTFVIRALRFAVVDTTNAVIGFSITFFKTFQVLAPIVGKAAGIIAYGIGLIVKGATLGVQTLMTVLLLPVVAISKVMQGILIAVRYVTQQIYAEVMSVGYIFIDLISAIRRGDIVGGFVAFGRLIPTLIQAGMAVGFFGLKRFVTTGIILLVGAAVRIAKDGITLLFSTIIPYVVKKSYAIGLAIVRGIVWGIQSGYKALTTATLAIFNILDQSLITIGRNVSRGMGIVLTSLNQMRMFGVGVVAVFAGFIGTLVFVNNHLGFAGMAFRGLLALFGSTVSLPMIAGLSAVIFLLWQATHGFKELNAMIDALNHPVKWLQDSMANIAKTFSGGINTDWIAFFVEKLIRVIPIVLGGIFLLGFAVKKHIFGGFMLVWDVVKGIANSLINVVRSAKAIPGAVMGIGTEGRILEGVHKTRSTLGLYKDPQSKDARENEFKLAKESAMLREKVIANSQAQIVTLAQQQKTDYGHLAREVEVTKGGFFGIGARKQKEWQLTGAGEEFQQKRLAETLEAKTGVFGDRALKDVAKAVSPARLGMMQGDELRAIFTKDRPDLAALGRALETIKTQNVAVMNVARMNGGGGNNAGNPNIENVKYSRAELERLQVVGLEKGQDSFASTELRVAQVTKALKNLNVPTEQLTDNYGDLRSITQNTKKFIERLLQYQLAAASGKIDNDAARGVASVTHLQEQFKLDTVDKGKLGDPAQFHEVMKDKVAVLQAAIRNGSHAALKDFNFDGVASQLKDATSEEDYQLRLKGALQNMMGHQLKTVENTFNQTPTIFETEASKLRSVAGQAPDKISHGLKGILSDVMGGIGQAITNAAKKLPGRRDGLSNEALRAIDRQIAGVAPLPDQRAQDSRRSKLEAAQRQLREGQLSSEKQQQVLQTIANLIQRDVYELTHPTMNPEQLRARVDRAKGEREKLFNGMRGGNKALEQWISQFTAEEQRAISQQIKEGRFRGGALTTRGEDRTITEGTQRKVVPTYINNEASLARALGYENIKQVEQAFSTDEVLKNAKRSWGEQLRHLVGINEDTDAYNKQIDALRTQIDQRVERQTSGFAEREARRNAAMANREAGFLAQLNQVGRSRADFTARLNTTQQQAFEDFLKTGKLQSTRPDAQFEAMRQQLGFADVESFKKFQQALAKSENKEVAEYLKNALLNDPERLRGMGTPITTANGTQINPNDRLKELIGDATGDRLTAFSQLETIRNNRRRNTDPDATKAWEHALDYLATGQDTTDLTVEQIAEIGRAMELQGDNESVAMQLRSIANQRNTGFGGITDSIKSFLKNIETDAESVEEYIHNRLTDMSSFSVFGVHPLATISDVLRNVLFEPIVSLVKGTWKWLGNAIGNIGTNAAALKARATGLLTSLPGVRTFAQARQRRETDRQSSLQSLSAKMGYENQEKFAEEFKKALAARGITEGRLQNKALQAVLNSRRSKGVAETLNTSRFQEIQDSSSKIGEALAATLGLNGSPEEIAKLLAPGGFTTRAVGPLRNYFLKAVVPAIVDAGLAPLKLIWKIVSDPRMSLAAIKTKTGQIADAVADFMVSSYTTIRRTFSYAATQLGKVPLFGKIWGAVSGFFGKIASRIQSMAAPATTQRLRNLQNQRQIAARGAALTSARAGEIEPDQINRVAGAAEASDRGVIGQLNARIATLSQFRTQEISRLNPFQRLLVFATTAARGAKNAWAQTAEEISEGGWRGLIARFDRVGYLLKRNISEGSPGPSADTRANWEHTQQSVSANMGEIANSAHVAGQQIQGDMQRTARRSAGFLGALGGAVAGAGKAGMAVGGAITAIGFAAQTASYSLVNMGLLDEASAANLNKFLEIFTLVGAVGGLMAPVMGAIVSSVTAIGSAFALIFNPVTLTMAAITGGILLANEGLKRFAGIDLLGPMIANVQEPIAGTISFIQGKIDEIFLWMTDKFGTQLSPILEPMGAAVATIQGAWQGFVDWFVAMPLVQTAIDIGTGLINALNHNPTVQIPLAWEGAVENIKGMLFNLPFVGDLIAGLMKDALDPTKILGNLFQGFHSMLDQLEKSGLARFGGGKLLDGLRGFLGGFGKKKEVQAEIPVQAGVKLDYKDALEAAIRKADFDARSGRAGSQEASASLQYQLQTTGGQMTGDQIGAAYQGPGGEFLQQAIAKQNNRLFLEQGAAAKEKRASLQDELQEITQKEVKLQATYAEAIAKVKVAAEAPAPTGFFQKLFGGKSDVEKFAAQAATASQAMVQLQEQHTAVQQKIAANSFVFDAGTDQMLKNIGIDPDGLKVAVADAKVAVAAGIKEVGYAVSDRWRYLERSNGGNLSAMMTTDLKKAGGAFRILKGDVADFAKRAATSLGQMDWAGFKDAAGDFWTNLQFGLGQIASGFGGAGLSALLFYVHLSPLAFVLGGIALAGLAIATNFLGLRTILVGLIRVFTGFAQVAVSSVMTVVNVVRGLVKIFGGIPDALRGDFTRLGEGVEIVWTGIKDGARGLFRGLGNIFGGGLEVLEGLFQGLKQTVGIVFGPALLNSAREAVAAIKQLFESAGETIANALKKPGQVLDKIANRFRKGKEEVFDSPVGRTVGAIADVASGKAPSLDAARVAHDFDMRMRGKDPQAELTAGDRARLAQSQMENVLSTGFDTSRHLGPDIMSPTGNQGVLSEIDDELRRAEAGLGSMRDRSVSAAGAANDALSSLGVALSSFAPALAAPLFMVGDLLSGFTGMSLALPQLTAMFPGASAAIGGFTTALSTGGLTATGVIAGLGTVFTGTMAAISSAASIAWVAVSGPMLPLFVLVGGLVAAFVMFKTNFLGFGDIVSGVFGGIQDVVGGIWQVITDGIRDIGSAVGKIGGLLIKPLEPLLQLFGISTGNLAGQLQTAFVANAISTILRPIQAIGFAVKTALQIVFAVIKAVLWLGGLIVKIILTPITLVTNAVAGIVRGFQALGSILGSVITAPFQFLQGVVSWIWDRLMQLPALLGQAIANVPLIGPLLQNLGNTIFQSGAQTPVQQFASGGAVVGPGSGTADRIPALLSNGEFVVSAKPAQENMGLLTALNEGRSVEVMPMPAPTRIPLAIASKGEAAQADAAPKQMPPVEININLQGDIVLAGTNSAADAQEFLTKIEPYLQQAVWGMFRNWVDFNR